MTDLLYMVTVPIAYGILFVGLQVLGNVFIWLGSLVNRASHRPQAQDKSMWLFSMLMGLTRYPTIIMGTVAYTLFLLSQLTGDPVYTLLESFAILCFGTFLVIRLVCLLLGGILFGESIKGILKSLNS